MSVLTAATAAASASASSGHYLHWGVVSISVANLVVIGSMVVAFVLALVLPFPHDRNRS